MLVGFHAENTNLLYKRFRESLRLHHHGEDEKAHPYSANKRDAFGIAFFNQVVVSWRPVKAGRQSLFVARSPDCRGSTRRLKHHDAQGRQGEFG